MSGLSSLPSRPAPVSELSERWIAVAHLLRPQGRRGEILADPLTDQPEVFHDGQSCRLARDEAAITTTPTVVLQGCWRPQGRNLGRLVLKFAGVDSISDAEALEDLQLFLPVSSLPALDTGTYLVRDLLGCELFDGTRLLGTITGLQFPTSADGRTRLLDAADLLVLHPQNAPAATDPVLIPFVKSWLESVHIGEKRIRMHLPPGLLDDESKVDLPGSSE